MTSWTSFFPPGAPVIALPSWHTPRLFIPADSAAIRWARSGLYPAFRTPARVFRLALRLKAAASLGTVKHTPPDAWTLEPFVKSVLPGVASVSVLVGTPGPAQKVTVECREASGRVVGYVKYAESSVARERLRHEHALLVSLPGRIGPSPLKYGRWHHGDALIVTPLPGDTAPAVTPPPASVLDLTLRLVTAEPAAPARRHPGLQHLLDRPELAGCLDALDGRSWPVAIRHGDLAPWNVVIDDTGRARAFDWEHGALRGFPFLDYLYYVLQTAALVQRRSPEQGARMAVSVLQNAPVVNLGADEAAALVRLAAFDGSFKLRADGLPPDAPLLTWQRSIWEDASWTD